MNDHPGPRREAVNPRGELHSTYFVQNRSSHDEMTRLRLQDHLFTRMMGGVLPEQSDPTTFEHVLDVGCGTGGWLIEVAKTYPSIKRLVGIDISKHMIDAACEQAKEQQVADRVEFAVMDALHTLAFPKNVFHLVNHRLGVGWVRTWEWPRLLTEYQRVARLHGTIRLTEAEIGGESSSLANRHLSQLMRQALYQAGNFFTPEPDGVTSQLAALLQQYAGVRDQQMRSYALRCQVGTPEWQSISDDARLAFRTALPFLHKWTRVPDDYEQIYQQMLEQMQQPDFAATWNVLTVWGTKG